MNANQEGGFNFDQNFLTRTPQRRMPRLLIVCVTLRAGGANLILGVCFRLSSLRVVACEIPAERMIEEEREVGKGALSSPL